MAGNVRFESSLAEPEDLSSSGSYLNGSRMSYASASLDRSGSFRDGGENRMYSSSPSMMRGSGISMGDLPPLPEFLPLDPITMGDQKYIRSGELRRALGISFGSTTEENSFGASHLKHPPPMATEELKRIRSSVSASKVKARGRVKKLDESLNKLDKYEALKQQRKEMSTTERSGGPNLLKMGIQTHRNASDIVIQRPGERAKSVVLNKRVRSSVAEIRGEARTYGSSRHPPLIGKDGDLFRDSGEGSDLVEEKIRRLPVGGETWDRKVKRKRSVGAVFTRPMDGDGELKHHMTHKLNNEPGLRSPDAQSFRSGSSNMSSGTNNLDGTPLHTSSSACTVPENELAKVSLLRDTMPGTKERLLVKGNNKLNVREDSHVASPNPLAKAKGSRAPRSGPVTAGNSSPNISRMSGSVDSWEHPPSLNKVLNGSGTNNRKRSVTAASSSPPMAQWVGQRPQKMSRTRRANLVSPISNHDEVQFSSEGYSPSDTGTRMTSLTTNGSLLSRGITNSNPVRMARENVSSPARLSESEESGAMENLESRLKENGSGSGQVDERALSTPQNNGPSILLTRKNKVFNKEEIVDCVRRQGRVGRGSPFSSASISPPKEKLEVPTSAKLLKSTRPASEKNGSKSGRPLKKLSDRKTFTRLGITSSGGAPDFTGESDDDHEELLAAAKFACKASYSACSSSFWRKMEFVFASVSLEDASFLKQELKSSEENHQKFSQMLGHENTSDLDSVHEEFKSESVKGFPPLYQRVLSALIAIDGIEEFEETDGRNRVSHYFRDESAGASCLSVDIEPRKRVMMDFESEPTLGLKSQKQWAVDRFSCNGSTTPPNGTDFSNHLLNGELFQGDHVYTPSQNGFFHELPENDLDGSVAMRTNMSANSSFHSPFEQMCLDDKLLLELQSIDLCPETVPGLTDGEDGAINLQILELEKERDEQVSKKKIHLNKIIRQVEESRKAEEWFCREQIAMDKLVELAYKKLLATRGSIASKLGVPKVSKQAALSFMKRTLLRCRRFEDAGKSCFIEPRLRDAILAAPPHRNDAETADDIGWLVTFNLPPEIKSSQLRNGSGRNLFYPSDLDFAKTGPILNRGKKKEVLLDDVGGSVSVRATSTFGNTLLGGAKGKRSERERDRDMLARKSVAKSGRPSESTFKGERKTKTKPKQKTSQLSPPGNRFCGDGNGSNRKRESDLMSLGGAKDSSKEMNDSLDFTNLPMHDLESIELGIGNELGGHQDLSFWLNIDEDGLQDPDIMGLDIPMDDLSDLNMIL